MKIRVKQKNSRIFIKFLALLLISVILGYIFGAYIVSGVLVARNHLLVLRYFEGFESRLSSLSDFLDFVINNSRIEIFIIILLFFAAFSLINFFITEVVIAASGFISSFFCVFAFRVALNEAFEPNIGILVASVYAIFKIASLCLLFYISCRFTRLSQNIRNIDISQNFVLNKINTVRLIVYALTALCGVVFLKSIYCLTIFLIN